MLITLVILSSLQAYSATLSFRHYSVKEGLANSTAYDVFQDSRDFIWIATESGVNRFDGNKFELFTMDNGLSDNEVLQIREDSSGRIWFLTLNGKPSYFFKEKFYNTSTDPLLKKVMGHGSLTSFFEDSAHRLWFSTNQNKLVRVNPDGSVRVYSSPQYSFVNAVVLETARKEILVFSERYAFKLNRDEFSLVQLQHSPLSPRSIFFEPKNKGIFFLSTPGLMQLYNDQTLKTVAFRKELPAPVSSVYFNQNEVWIGTMGRGLLLYNIQTKQAEYHLENLNISHVFADRQGNIWISTIGRGVYLLPAYANQNRHLTTTDGLSAEAITAVTGSSAGLILGYANGALDLFQNGTIKNLVPQLKERYNPVKKIYKHRSSGSLWYASDNTLLSILNNGKQTNLLNDPKWSSYALKSFDMDSRGNIAIALASGVYILQADYPSHERHQTDLSIAPHFPNRAFAVHYDRENGLWFSNIEGLHYYKNGKLTEPYRKHAMLRHRITDIATLPDNTTICSSYGFGVFILKDARLVKTITTDDGLSSNICKKLFVEGSDAWVVTGKGVSKISFQKNEPEIQNFSTEDGLLSNEINDIYVDQDTAYVATNSGLTIFNKTNSSAQSSIPPVVIRALAVNNQPVQIEKLKHLSHAENNVSVTFICMDYAHPDQVIYSYRTDSREPWIETKEQTIEFSSLKPGRYELEIRARSMYTDWTRSTFVPININVPFWLRWWFISLAAALAILTLFLLIRRYYRMKQIAEKEELLTKARIISLEQQALQAMMNPHFIFNVMNSIQYFINTRENAMANQVLTGFARLIRKNLEICNKSYINVEEEITYLNLYLSLEKLRFGDRLSYVVTTNTDLDLRATYIPSMLLQPYVENAIWHGIMPMDEPGEIRITITKENDVLMISISDNGIGIEESLRSKTSEHISRGMQLTQQRVDLLNKFNKDRITISVKQQPTGGTNVTIKVPLQPFTHSS